MAIIRTIPRKGRQPALTGRLMIDTVRGVLRVRKWPRKRPGKRTAIERFWTDWFVQANKLAKYADGMSQARAIQMTKGSGMYPRDVLLKAMRGRLYTWTTPDGWKWYPMAAIGDVSESLDVLAQTVGSVLVRAVDRWRAPPDGVIGDVLTYKGLAAPPVWQAPTGGGGAVQQVLAGTPIIPDNTVTSYDVAVEDYNSVSLTLDNVGFAGSDVPKLLVSTDGGITFRAGASDYHDSYLQGSTQVNRDTDRFALGVSAGASAMYVEAFLANLRAGRAILRTVNARSTRSVRFLNGFANFDGPITHFRIGASFGNNLNAGTIRLVGQVAG